MATRLHLLCVAQNERKATPSDVNLGVHRPAAECYKMHALLPDNGTKHINYMSQVIMRPRSELANGLTEPTPLCRKVAVLPERIVDE